MYIHVHANKAFANQFPVSHLCGSQISSRRAVKFIGDHKNSKTRGNLTLTMVRDSAEHEL